MARPAKIVDAGIPRQGGGGHEVCLWAAVVIILISYCICVFRNCEYSICCILVYTFGLCLFCFFIVVLVAVVVLAAVVTF